MKLLIKIFPLFFLLACFAACEDIPMPYEISDDDEDSTRVIEPSGTGTLEDPYNIAGVVKFGKTLEADVNSDPIYFKGIVTSFKKGEEPGNSYGNATYYLADSEEARTTFYVYRGYSLKGAKFTSADELKVGDTVVVYSPIVNYKGNTLETVQNKAQLISINSGQSSDKDDYIYTSSNLNEGWHSWTEPAATRKINDPWSLGSSYAQATGYQKWDGADTKSNREAEGYLISPAINTTAASGKVKIGFDNCVGYAANDPNFADHIHVYVSKISDGSAVNLREWVKLNWTATHVSTDWTLTKDEIQLPDEFVNQENVHFAFYFYTPAEKSCTFELKNFFVAEGEASNSDTPTPPTPSGESSKDKPYTVAQAQSASDFGYVRGYIVGFVDGKTLSDGARFTADGAVETNLLIADKAGETDLAKCLPVQLPTGDIRSALNLKNNANNIGAQVILYGSFEKYFGVAGIKSVSWAQIYDREVGKDPEKDEVINGSPKGTGTEADPYNVAGVLKYIATLGADKNSPNEVFVIGTVTNVKEIDTGQYGNATFTLSDDTPNPVAAGGAPSNEFMVYRCYSFGNEKFTNTNAVNVGDQVIVKGLVVNYKGNTPETVQNRACLYSVNGAKQIKRRRK